MNNEDSIVTRTRAGQDWERARQAATIEGVLSIFTSRSSGLLSFEDVRKRLRLKHKTYRGLQDIEIAHIRGSVGRYQDFTGTFLPRREDLRQRWLRVSAVTYSKGAPPIEVYQVGEAYFVLDGNHRVSVARQRGSPTIQAHVCEFPTPAGLSGDANLDEVLIKAEHLEFLDNTRLDELRPDHHIAFTAPGRYRELEYQIMLYQQVLEQIDEEPVSYEDAVTAWYDMIYTPSIQIIQEQGVLERFAGRTEADLFIWVWRHNEELRARGIASLAQAADEVAQPLPSRLASRVWQALTGWLRHLHDR